MSFIPGDTVVHSRYGAGEVRGVREIERDGDTIRYVTIELADDRGTLMIPEDQFEEKDLRPAMTSLEVIREVLYKAPQALSDNHRVRQSKVEKHIKSGNPRKIAQSLRDLSWREATDRLTGTDSRLLGDAITRLAQELALHPTKTLNGVRKRLTSLIDEAIAHHNEQQLSEEAAAGVS